MNMFQDGVFNADIRKGDTLHQHISGVLMSLIEWLQTLHSRQRNGKDAADADPYGRYPGGTSKGCWGFPRLSSTWLRLECRRANGGCCPSWVLSGGSSEKDIRKGILEDDLLEAVIDFHPRCFMEQVSQRTSSSIKRNLWKKEQVLFINGELNIRKQKPEQTRCGYHMCWMSMTQEDENGILKLSHGWTVRTTTTWIFEDMQTPHRYQNSLMWEQSRWRACLRVEDEYSGVWTNDVLVFVRRDNEYYDFKPAIQTKEQIRDHIGNKEQSVINQFERWWDKYRVSLHEIDTQAKQSEEVMWGYLKELGYEWESSRGVGCQEIEGCISSQKRTHICL